METSPKDVLYRQINEISESKILKEMSSGGKKGIVAEILRRCIPEIAKLGGGQHENFGVFAESLSHYLLTNALVPSQRKITIKNTEIDLVIPDSRTLDAAPKNSLVLHFVKTADESTTLESLERLQNIQPHRENIWVVSKTQSKIPYKTYHVDEVSS
ncbi:MAG: hypothetical protein ACREAX_01165, partial [Candidatus Nitrosotenuis sp.]